MDDALKFSTRYSFFLCEKPCNIKSYCAFPPTAVEKLNDSINKKTW